MVTEQPILCPWAVFECSQFYLYILSHGSRLVHENQEVIAENSWKIEGENLGRFVFLIIDDIQIKLPQRIWSWYILYTYSPSIMQLDIGIVFIPKWSVVTS